MNQPEAAVAAASSPAPLAASRDGGPVLSVRGITRSFGGHAVLRGIDLDLRPGEVLGLLGENGAGKSTLMNIVSGNLPPDRGQVLWRGTPTRWSGPRAAIEAGIAFVHQELSTIGALSVMENIFLGEYRSRRGLIDRRRMREGARALLERVGAGHIDPDARAETLRVADQQAIEIAKALHGELHLLLLDEPTSSLTAHEARALFAVMAQLRARGVSIVFITHRLEEALSVCDRIVVLRDGALVSDRKAAETTKDRIIAEMAGRAVIQGRSRAPLAPADRPPVLEVEGLSDGRLVRDISFALRPGDVLGLFGLVGAGRTELLQMLAGARPVAAGTMRLGGAPYAPAAPKDAIAAGVALLPEGRKTHGILPSRPLRENVSVSVLRRLSRFGLIDRRREAALVRDAFERLGIVARGPGQPIRTLSGGNQQKVILSRCLAVAPRLLLLDEPTHGVDVRTKAQIYDIIAGLAAEGMAVIVVSSEMTEVLALPARVIVLSAGRMAGDFTGEAIEQVALVRAAFRYVEGAGEGTPPR